MVSGLYETFLSTFIVKYNNTVLSDSWTKKNVKAFYWDVSKTRLTLFFIEFRSKIMCIQNCNIVMFLLLFHLFDETKQIARDNIVASVSGIFNLRAGTMLQYPAIVHQIG